MRNPLTPTAGSQTIFQGLDAGIDATPTLQWDAQNGVVSYDLRITDANGDMLYLATDLTETSHRVARELPLGNSYASLRANYPDGSRNEWRRVEAVVVFGQPAVQVIGTQVIWNTVPAATTYEIWIDRTDQNGNRIQRQAVYSNDVRETSFSVANLGPGHYSVWVRAIRAEGGQQHFSFWSSRVTFQITSNLRDLRDAVDPETELLTVSLQSEKQLAAEEAAQPQETAERDADTKPQADTSDAEVAEQDAVMTVMAEVADVGVPEEAASVSRDA